MRQQAAEPGRARALVELRRSRVREAIRRPLRRMGDGAEPLPRDRLEHLRREAEELYWTELAWEELTDEERVADGHLTELVFPALLAFVDGLVLERASPDGVRSRPHPDVVEELLLFLADRYLTLTRDLENGADSGRLVWARVMTARLIDLVLYRLHGLSSEEREEIEVLG